MQTHLRSSREICAVLALVAMLLGALGTAASAAVFQFQATARNDNPDPTLVDFVPLGTPVTASFTLDVGPGKLNDPSFPTLTLLGGSLSWTAGGPQTFVPASADIFPLGVCQNCGPVGNPTDWVTITLEGPGATKNGFTMTAATISLDLGFGAIATGQDFTDLLLLNPSAMNIGFRFQPQGQFGSFGKEFRRDIQSSITPAGVVPLPGAGWLLAGALAGLGVMRRRVAG